MQASGEACCQDAYFLEDHIECVMCIDAMLHKTCKTLDSLCLGHAITLIQLGRGDAHVTWPEPVWIS